MEYINIIIGISALFVALWALNLQRKEIIKNGRVTALIHASTMLQEQIDYRSKIMNDIEKNSKWWMIHKKVINDKLRPLKNDIDIEFIELVSKYDGILHEKKLMDVLKPKT